MGYFICGPESEELCLEIGVEVPFKYVAAQLTESLHLCMWRGMPCRLHTLKLLHMISIPNVFRQMQVQRLAKPRL